MPRARGTAEECATVDRIAELQLPVQGAEPLRGGRRRRGSDRGHELARGAGAAGLSRPAHDVTHQRVCEPHPGRVLDGLDGEESSVFQRLERAAPSARSATASERGSPIASVSAASRLLPRCDSSSRTRAAMLTPSGSSPTRHHTPARSTIAPESRPERTNSRVRSALPEARWVTTRGRWSSTSPPSTCSNTARTSSAASGSRSTWRHSPLVQSRSTGRKTGCPIGPTPRWSLRPAPRARPESPRRRRGGRCRRGRPPRV